MREIGTDVATFSDMNEGELMSTSRAYPLSLTIATCFALGGLAAAGWGAAQSFQGHQALDRGIALSGAEGYEIALPAAGRFTAYQLSSGAHADDLQLVDRELYLDVAPTPFGPHQRLAHRGDALTPIASWDLGHPGRYELSAGAGAELLLVRDAEALSNQLSTARTVGFAGIGLFGLGMLLASFTLALGRTPQRRRRRRVKRRRREGVIALPYEVAAEQIALAQAISAESTMPELHLHPSSYEEMPLPDQEWEEPSFDSAA
jgi:hypothetical protein